MNRKNPVAIPLSENVPAFNAPEELLAAEQRKVEAHQGYGLKRYHVLRAKFEQKFRRNIVAPDMHNLGVQMEEVQKQAKEKKRVQQKSNRLAADLGIAPSSVDTRRPVESMESLLRFKQSLKELENLVEKENEEESL